MPAFPNHLAAELQSIVGRSNVISGAEDLLVYECDAFTLEKNLPNLVVLPGNSEETAEVVRACLNNEPDRLKPFSKRQC